MTVAQGQITFQKIYGGTNSDYAYSAQQTNDGGFIITGVASSFSSSFDVYLIKTSFDGTPLWTKTFGGTDNESGSCVQQTNDGGFIISGATYSFGGGQQDVYVVKTTSDGSLQWSKTYGGSIDDSGTSIQQTNDGGYIIAGNTGIGFNGGAFYLMKILSDGSLQWTKTYGGTNEDYAYSTQQTNDGGFIIAGTTKSFGAGTYYDVYLVKTDTDGTLQWSKTYGSSLNDEAYSVTQTSDGGYFLSGQTNSFGVLGNDLYVVKTDVNGNPLWSKALGGAANEDTWSKGIQTNDGGYAIGTFGGSFGAGNGDFYFIKTDNLGNSGCNQITVATVANPWTSTVINPPDSISNGGVELIVTTTETNPPTLTDTLCFALSVSEILYNHQIQIFPNPFSAQTVLQTNNPLHNATLTLYNYFGQTVKEIKNISGQTVTFNRDNLPNGLYFIRLTQDNKVITVGKLVITDN